MSDNSVGIYIEPNDCSIAVIRNKKIEIIPNENGNRTTPSVIQLSANQIFIGRADENILKENPKNTVYGIREIIGKNFDDSDLPKFINKVPFKIEKDLETDKPKIIIKYLRRITSFFPEQIYTMLIQKLILYK